MTKPNELLAGTHKKVPLTVPSSLFMGYPGTGKTHLLTSALEYGKKLFVLATEGNALDTIFNSAMMRKKVNPKVNLDDLYWQYIPPVNLSIDHLRAKAQLANTNDIGELQQLKASSLMKKDFPQFINFIRALGKLTDDRTGKVIGNMAALDDSWVFAVDSLTSLTDMATQNVKGIRPSTTLDEYGIIQELLRDVINNLCSLNCFFVMTAHIEREPDEEAKVDKIMPATIGKKLSPKIPRYFSEVVRTYNTPGGFVGSTIDIESTVKHRYFPRSGKFPLDLGPVIQGYTKVKEEFFGKPEPDGEQVTTTETANSPS